MIIIVHRVHMEHESACVRKGHLDCATINSTSNGIKFRSLNYLTIPLFPRFVRCIEFLPIFCQSVRALLVRIRVSGEADENIAQINVELASSAFLRFIKHEVEVVTGKSFFQGLGSHVILNRFNVFNLGAIFVHSQVSASSHVAFNSFVVSGLICARTLEIVDDEDEVFFLIIFLFLFLGERN